MSGLGIILFALLMLAGVAELVFEHFEDDKKLDDIIEQLKQL